MQERRYAWRRYWGSQGKPYPADADGFALSPAEAARRYIDGSGEELQNLEAIPVLVLLGEPGMGKSTALTDEAIRREANGMRVRRIDLKTVGAGGALRDELDEALRSPLDDLAVDSLDEALLRVDTILDTILRRLRSEVDAVRSGHLRVRIACRAAEWPESATGKLVDLFGEDAVSVCLLAPLTRADVGLAAAEERLDDHAFVAEVEECGAVPFAVRPVTLRLLLGKRLRGEPLPNRQIDLYEDGCLALCAEIDDKRRRHAVRLDPRQRLAVARRLAALLVFTQRPFIDARPPHMADPAALSLAQAAHGSEVLNGHEIPVTEYDVREVLETALFRPLGPGCFVFAHWSYAEFLAASYPIAHALPDSRILALVRHPGFPGTLIPPQLAETAAWLASHSPALFRALVRDNPETMLRSDVATAQPADRALLVEAYLAACAEGRALDWEPGRQRLYRRMGHPGLAAQLRPVIQDRSTDRVARRTALDIAEACRISALEGDLLAVALNEGEDPDTRSNALWALIPIAGEESRRALLPLALGHAGDDPSDELRGKALPLVWPGILDTGAMITSLTYPKRPNYLGAYRLFLQNALLASLPSTDLETALHAMATWVNAHSLAGPDDHRALSGLAARLAQRGLRTLHEPGVRMATAELLAALNKASGWHGWEDVFGDAKNVPTPSVADRRALAKVMAHTLADDDAHLLVFDFGILFRDDLHWALENVRSADTDAIKRFWTDVVRYVWQEDIDGFGAICDVAAEEPVLREAFAPWFDGVPTHGQAAEAGRRRLQSRRRREAQQAAEADLSPSCDTVCASLRRVLDEVEQGDAEAWWQIIPLLHEQPGDAVSNSDLQAMETLPGFACLDNQLRTRVHTAALPYVLKGTPECEGDDWWNQSGAYVWPAAAGVYALDWLTRAASGISPDLDKDVWEKWAPAVVAFPWSGGTAGAAERLLPLCLSHARDTTLAALRHRVGLELASGEGLVLFSRHLRGCWNEDLATIVAETAAHPDLHPHSLDEAMGLLAEHHHDAADAHFASCVQLPTTADPTQKDRAAIVVGRAFVSDPPARWPALKALMNADPPLAATALLSAYRSFHRDPVPKGLADLPEGAWRDMYLSLATNFPPREQRDGVMRAPDHARDFERLIVRSLVERGTPDAVRMLEDLAVALPHAADLFRWHLITARRNLHRKTWQPPSPAAVIEAVSRSGARLVRSGEELLELVVNSLARLQARFQGETPLARSLWNERGDWTPKDENFLSDLVKAHLVEDLGRRGAVANREVEIRAAASSDAGQRTDIRVDAVVHRPGRAEAHALASVIVEVKGCWHRDLRTAMQEQLHDRYMVDAPCPFGLYLIGWFVCKRWKTPMVAGRRPPEDETIEVLRAALAAQAAALSSEERRIAAVVLDCAVH